jgi:hypothetical protein
LLVRSRWAAGSGEDGSEYFSKEVTGEASDRDGVHDDASPAGHHKASSAVESPILMIFSAHRSQIQMGVSQGGRPSPVHKLLRGANLPELHLFQSLGVALGADTPHVQSKER